MRELMSQSTSPVEGGVQGAGVDGLLDSAGQLVALPVEICDVFGAEVMVGGAGMLPYGRGILVGVLESDFVVMLFQPDMHGSFGVSGSAGVVVAAGARCVVNH
jgi:hypothetical protein